MDVKILTFDVGGSVFDWQTATKEAVSSLATAKGVSIPVEEFCFKWRRRMFETLAEMRHGKQPLKNADAIHRQVLDELSSEYDSFSLTSNEKDDLNEAWHRMPAWPDVKDALVKLRTKYTVSILTVLSLSIVVDSSKFAGIDWDAYLSCELFGVYKPDPPAYLKAAELFRVEPNEVLMVAVHPGDLKAAQRAGFKTAYVKPKVWELGSDGDTSGFDIYAEDYSDLADQLVS